MSWPNPTELSSAINSNPTLLQQKPFKQEGVKLYGSPPSSEVMTEAFARVAQGLSQDWQRPCIAPLLTDKEIHFLRTHTLSSIVPTSKSNDWKEFSKTLLIAFTTSLIQEACLPQPTKTIEEKGSAPPQVKAPVVEEKKLPVKKNPEPPGRKAAPSFDPSVPLKGSGEKDFIFDQVSEQGRELGGKYTGEQLARFIEKEYENTADLVADSVVKAEKQFSKLDDASAKKVWDQAKKAHLEEGKKVSAFVVNTYSKVVGRTIFLADVAQDGLMTTISNSAEYAIKDFTYDKVASGIAYLAPKIWKQSLKAGVSGALFAFLESPDLNSNEKQYLLDYDKNNKD